MEWFAEFEGNNLSICGSSNEKIIIADFDAANSSRLEETTLGSMRVKYSLPDGQSMQVTFKGGDHPSGYLYIGSRKWKIPPEFALELQVTLLTPRR